MLTKLGYLTRPITRTTNIIISPPPSPPITPTAWLPTDLSSLFGWWDASDASTIQEADNINRVSQWNDKSIFNNHLYQVSNINQPITNTTAINGLNSFDFGNGNAHFLSPNGTLNSTLNGLDIRDISIHVVFKQSNTNSNGALISFKSNNGSDSILPNFGATNRYYGPEDTGGNTYRILNPSPFSKNTVHLLGLEGNATDITLYKNGTIENNEGAASANNHFNRFIVGFRASAGQLWRGEIGEIILSKALNTADRHAIEGYLSHKWGV